MVRKSQAVKGRSKQKQQFEMPAQVMSVLRNSVVHKSIILLLLVTGMAWGWQQFSKVEILSIESVQIEGEFKYLSREALKKRALPHVQGGFFSVDLKAVRQTLIGLPWVEDASVRRQWPNKLSVRVIEKQPVAFWGKQGLLSSRADLFEPDNIDANIKLPQIYGPNGQHEFMLQELGRMQAWLMGTELTISKIEQDARRSWTLLLMSSTGIEQQRVIEVRLGRDSQHERLHRFTEIYNQRLKNHKQKIRHIDMRYTNGFAVAWQNQEA